MLGRAGLRYTTGVVAILAAALMGLTGCDWAQSRFDPARTGNNPFSGLTANNASTLRAVWSAPGSPNGVTLVARGLVLTSSMYAGPGPGRALNVSDGSVRWTSSVNFGAVDGTVAYGIGPGGLTAVSIDTGGGLWSASTAGFGVVGATEGKVFVLGAYSPPGYYIPWIQVWDASTHHIAWTFDDTDDRMPPAVANGVAYIVGTSSSAEPAETLHAIDLATGHERWSIPVRPSCQMTAAVISDGYVFWAGATYKASDGTFVANWPFCPTFGADHATAGTTVFAERPSTTPGAADFVSFDGITGTVHWSYRISTGIDSPTTFAVTNPTPVIGNNVVFAAVNGGTIGFNTATGTPVALLGAYPESAADGTLFAASATGRSGGALILSAFRPR